MTFLYSIQNWGVIILTFLLITSVGSVGYLKIRNNSLNATNQEYSQKIEDLKAAQELTEKLRKDNATLTAELNSIQTRLKGAAGYDTPLPTGIADVLKRVQSAEY